MNPTSFTAGETRLAEERKFKYHGTARVHLEKIQVNAGIHQELDLNKAKRLSSIFQTECCRRLDIENHVLATASSQDLTSALHKSEVTPYALRKNPQGMFPNLEFPEGGLYLLHGRHRIEVGQKHLPPGDRWWTVDIYSDGITPDSPVLLQSHLTNFGKQTLVRNSRQP